MGTGKNIIMTCQKVVKVVNLGRKGYKDAYEIQRMFAKQHLNQMAGMSNAKAENVLLLVEHNPVYTTGIRSNTYSEEDEAKLRKLGAEFFRTDRGGLITFHGHGQLVAYPVINLKHFKPSMKWYICAMEKTMINTCHYYGLQAHTTENTGVWIGERKIGAIGVHGRRYITTHGVSLNCNTDLDWYRHIVPCGLEGKDVTSLSREKGYTISISDAINPFLESFQKQFDCDLNYESDLADEHRNNSNENAA